VRRSECPVRVQSYKRAIITPEEKLLRRTENDKWDSYIDELVWTNKYVTLGSVRAQEEIANLISPVKAPEGFS
jgi:hypothetical protein